MARRWDWFGKEDSFQVAVAAAPSGSIVESEGLFVAKGNTVARILGNAVVTKGATSVGAPKFGMGIILLNDGVTVFPSPLVEYNAPWLYHMVGFLPAFDAAGDFGATRFMIDVHGMRKIDADTNLYFIGAADPAVTISYYYGLRVGIKLA